MIRIFQRFEVLKASGKLNIVLLSWERTCWTTLIQSCDEKRVVDVVHVGHSAQVRKLIEPKTP